MLDHYGYAWGKGGRSPAAAEPPLCSIHSTRFSSQKPYCTNASDVPRSLQSGVLTIQTVVLTAGVFHPFIKTI